METFTPTIGGIPPPTQFVAASPKEILLAQELRRQIEMQYLGRCVSPDPYGSVRSN